MARVSADTLRTRPANGTPAADPARRGRRPTNGNPAQAPRQQARQQELPAGEPEEPAEPDTEEIEETEETVPATEPAQVPPAETDADTDELPSPPAQPSGKQTRGRKRTTVTGDEALDDEQRDLIALGKLTRFAIENGLSIDDCVERFRVMVDAYDRHVVR